MISILTDTRARLVIWPWVIAALFAVPSFSAESLPGTGPLELARDDEVVHARCMKQVTGYFQRRIAEARESRRRTFKPDFSSVENYEKSMEPYRVRCRKLLGLANAKAESYPTVEVVGEGADCCIERVTIPFGGPFKGNASPRSWPLHARGLMIRPNGSGHRQAVIVCPDADIWPERVVGLVEGGQTPGWLSSLLAEGAIVFVIQSIERLSDQNYCISLNKKDRRHVLYRLAYPVGRTMPGLDVQDAKIVIDYLVSRPDVDADRIVIAGIGQGGMTALYTAAVDRRVSTAVVVDYFQDRDRCWEEPVDRRLCGQLSQFGDAELAAMVAPRRLWIVQTQDSSIADDRVTSEARRAQHFFDELDKGQQFAVRSIDTAENAPARRLLPDVRIDPDTARAWRDPHFGERLSYLHRLMERSEAERQARWNLTDCEPAEFGRIRAGMLKDYRELVGHVACDDVPLNPKTELALETDRYKLYRITLDVTEGVEVYGNLLVPNDIRGRRAAVICQHGLSGTPEMTTGLGMTGDTPYHEFARCLAEHGYVVFSPYLMQRKTDEINKLVRMADAVGMMRVAMPVAKTNRIIDFLEGLPFVDGKRIGYYGLSYGGYSAIWISPLAPRLAAVVISGHFNDWRSKITNDTLRTSYLWHPDEDFYNWNILHRFTHPELIAIAAPRPACVEFAQRDGITTPEWTAYAWKQVVGWRDHLGFSDRVELVHFDGVHEIQAIGTTDFLDRFLRPSRPVGRDYGDTSSAAGLWTRYPHAARAEKPFVTQVLDSADESRITGRFWIPSGGGTLNGMAVKLSRVGRPGTLEIRFGSRIGKQDFGIGKLQAEQVPTAPKASWHEVGIVPRAVREGQLVYFEIRSTDGTSPENQYTVYGPRPIGGKDFPERFGLSYRVLLDSSRK